MIQRVHRIFPAVCSHGAQFNDVLYVRWKWWLVVVGGDGWVVC